MVSLQIPEGELFLPASSVACGSSNHSHHLLLSAAPIDPESFLDPY